MAPGLLPVFHIFSNTDLPWVDEIVLFLIDTNKSEIFSAHFHDTRALGLANVFSSLDQGITKFDSSIGGLGGCPFAPGSSGNLATEDLVSMLEMMNINTGINLDYLINTRDLASKMTSLDLSGRIL